MSFLSPMLASATTQTQTQTQTHTHTHRGKKMESMYHRLSIGSGPDNVLIVPGLAKNHGEVRFYPDGAITLIEYGTAAGFTLSSPTRTEPFQMHGKYVLDQQHSLVFADRTYTVTDLRQIMLDYLDLDALFTAPDVMRF